MYGDRSYNTDYLRGILTGKGNKEAFWKVKKCYPS